MHPIEVPIDVNFRPQKSRFFKRSVMLGILSICHQLKRKTLDFLSVVGTEKKNLSTSRAQTFFHPGKKSFAKILLHFRKCVA